MRRVLEFLGAGLVVHLGLGACEQRPDRAPISPPQPARSDSEHTDALAPVAVPSIPTALAQIESGSRLRITWWTTPDGLVSPRGLRDTELDFDCGVIVDGQGNYRCAPLRYGLLHFGDSECSQPVVSLYADQSKADPV